jgi:hypothetical protein
MSQTAGGSGGGSGAASAALGWSALKSGLLGASASGAGLAPDLVAGVAGFAVGTGAAVLGLAGGATPIGRICARAGLAAIPASAVNHKSELERRFISPINLFISNDNPASRKLNTSLPIGSPVAMTQQ